LIACAVFHTHFAGPAGVIPIVIMGILTYGFGLLIAHQRTQSDPDAPRWPRTLTAVLALSIPVLGLMYYKYRGFIFGSLTFLPASWLNTLQPFFALTPMPLAISFFTFEFVHYLTDVIKGQPPIRNALHFSLFSIFFPSIVSGPIKRYEHFVPQIERGLPRPTLDDFLWGLGQVLLGFAKKLIVADNAYLMIQLLERQAQWDAYSVSLLLILLSVRILFDFSGYSDIAIGLARMLGIRLPVNFNFPYWARNISEFWNRWHISLSSWIRDYLYIPLGGGRVSVPRKIFNLTLVMALCGLWHGAAWNFVFWGIYQGLGLGLHTLFVRWRERAAARGAIPLKFLHFPGIVARGCTLVFVAYGWLLFFYPLPQVLALTRSWFCF
jgi:alginate O-acetyltransferase complex protein AlgI